jgi:nucleotide-binding universal stress UspA family protein
MTQSTRPEVPDGAVLVGVDGSDRSLAAVRWAADEAVSRQAPLVLVHASPYLTPEATAESGHAWAVFARAEAEAADHAVGPAGQVVVAEAAVPALVRLSERAALVVLGATGSGGLDEVVLGSTLLGVSGEACSPVVGVRQWPLPSAAERVVVLGLDSVAAAAAAVDVAFDLARRRCRRLVVVHAHAVAAVSTGSARPGECAGLPDDLAVWRRRYPDVDVSYRFPRGRPATALLELAGQAEAVVTGSRRRGPAARALLGSTSRMVLRYSPAPVIVTGRRMETPAVGWPPDLGADPHERSQPW